MINQYSSWAYPQIPSQNICKSNPSVCKRDNTSWPTGINHKNAKVVHQSKINVIHNIDKIKDKHHMISSADA